MGGNSQSILYSVPVSEKVAGESPVFRNPMFKDSLSEGPTPDIKDMKTALLTAYKKNENREALGTIIRKEGQPDTIKFITYGELLQEAVALGSGIIN